MNKKVIVGVVVGIVVVAVGLYVWQLQREAAKWKQAKEIVEENFSKEDGVTKTHLVSMVNAPLDKVQNALWDVEHSAQMVENVHKSDLVKQQGDTKTVDINLQALNLPLQHYVMEFTLHPAEHRISFKTVQSQTQDLEGSYQLEASPDGARTPCRWASARRTALGALWPGIRECSWVRLVETDASGKRAGFAPLVICASSVCLPVLGCSGAELRRDLGAGVDQALHGLDRLDEHGALGRVEIDLHDPLRTARADDHRHADVQAFDAVLAVQIRGASPKVMRGNFQYIQLIHHLEILFSIRKFHIPYNVFIKFFKDHFGHRKTCNYSLCFSHQYGCFVLFGRY